MHARLFVSVESASLPTSPLHLAIGIFDGVHRGHRAVIGAAVAAARAAGGQAAVLTFAPHPSVVLGRREPVRLIAPPAIKAELLDGLGVDAVVTHPFTREFARREAEAFLPWLRDHWPSLAGIYVGAGWRFGAGRRGDPELLAASGRPLGIRVTAVPPVTYEGEPVASTRIRTLLEAGEIAQANALLGYPYYAEGTVEAGKRLGRTLGFPTLNLAWAPELRPRYGVYLVRVRRNGLTWQGVANYGLRPSVDDATEPRLETHLLEDCPFDAGDTLAVEWHRFLRPEAAFPSLDALKAQIARDVETARAAWQRSS